jgi:glycosyltransferase involved in cell wall biosynthesis
MVVSDSCRQNFELSFPYFKEKLVTYNNVISPAFIRSQANEGATFIRHSKSKKILTVGRISPEKGQTVAIDALKILKDKGYDVIWFFVGDGKDRIVCEEKAVQMGLKDNAIFLGALTNPYGYMRDCDVYVQPSRYEGYCVTILEALCFSAPIVATNFTSVNEQLKDRENGLIVGMSARNIAEGIEKALFSSPIYINENKGLFAFQNLFSDIIC